VLIFLILNSESGFVQISNFFIIKMGGGPSKAPEGFDQMTFDKSKQFAVTIQYCGG
jgi:hypothetical protein